MEPNTASRLRERTRNKLKDYLVMAPALNVSHLLAFTLTPKAPSLRIVRLANGPTLSFRIERYSLMRDLLSSKRHSRSVGMEYLSPPLLVLASFPNPSDPSTPPHLNLVLKTFQSLFPPLSPHALAISSARRVVLVAYNADRGTIDVRHYIITVRPVGVSRRVRRIVEGATSKSKGTTGKSMLDLGNEADVADFLLRNRTGGTSENGYESGASSTDVDSAAGSDAERDAVSLPADFVGRGNTKGSKKAVRLEEVGPRLELKLIKVVEGVPGKEGGVLFHEFVKKSKKDAQKQQREHAERAKIRKQRREEQEANVARKKGKGKQNDDEDQDGSDGDVDMDADEEHEDEGAWDDDEEINEDEYDDLTGDEGAESSGDEQEAAPPPPRKKAKKGKP